MKKKTDCECPLAGYCNRHQVTKSNHLHKLCQTNNTYFNKWENCQGPGQQNVECQKHVDVVEVKKEEVKLPSTAKMAANFLQSAAKHAMNGMGTVPEEVQQARLEICHGCEYFLKESNRCGSCGCFLGTKTKWSTSSCPLGKW